MRLIDYLRRIHRIPHYLYWTLGSFTIKYVAPLPVVSRLWLINRYGHAPITRPGGPTVSLTTHGPRVRTAYFTIESIGKGRALPSRIILWLDEKSSFDSPPPSLQRLIRRGLELKLSKNYGPHTKYYPYVATEDTFQVPLVLADDDQLYPRYWLEELVKAGQDYPHALNCHWAAVVALLDGAITNYRAWKRCASPEPSFRHFALGVSGVIYPPALLQALKQAANAFEGCCPRADDLWLQAQALRAGFKTRQIHSKELQSLQTPGSQSIALWKENDRAGGNDRQIKATYTPEDIQIMLAD